MKKSKLWASIGRITTAMLFLSSWVVLGVSLAVSMARLEIKGNIMEFVATGVYASIDGSITNSSSTTNLEQIEINADSDDNGSGTYTSSWSNLTLEFANASDEVSFSVTITNNSTERAVYIKFIDNTSYPDNLTVSYSVNGTKVDEIDVLKIEASTSEDDLNSTTITFTYSITNENMNMKGCSLDMSMQLSETEPAKNVSYYNNLGLEFTTNSNGTSVSVHSTDTSITSAVIPSKVEIEGEVYDVTSIDSFSDCTSLTTITIPESVTFISSDYFTNCTSLTSVVLQHSDGEWKVVGYDRLQTLLGDGYGTPEAVAKLLTSRYAQGGTFDTITMSWTPNS